MNILIYEMDHLLILSMVVSLAAMIFVDNSIP